MHFGCGEQGGKEKERKSTNVVAASILCNHPLCDAGPFCAFVFGFDLSFRVNDDDVVFLAHSDEVCFEALVAVREGAVAVVVSGELSVFGLDYVPW